MRHVKSCSTKDEDDFWNSQNELDLSPVISNCDACNSFFIFYLEAPNNSETYIAKKHNSNTLSVRLCDLCKQFVSNTNTTHGKKQKHVLLNYVRSHRSPIRSLGVTEEREG